jgi:hypothetical protein
MERRRYRGSRIILREPLSQYSREELLDWIRQENVPGPRSASKEELIKIIKNSSILGGSGRIFPINPNEPTPDISVLPHETTQEFLHYLPLHELIKFCSISSEFSKYCKDSAFWESRSEYIHDTDQIIQTLEDAIKYGITVLALRMLEKLSKEKLNYPELSKVLLEIIQSGKLPLIRKMVEIWGKEIPEIFKMTNESHIHKSISVFTKKLKSRNFRNLDGIIETVYMLYVAFINKKWVSSPDFIKILTTFDKGIEYLLSNILRDVPEKFDETFREVMLQLMGKHNINRFVKYWDEYSPYLEDPEWAKRTVSRYDRYPYPYKEAINSSERV